MEAPRAEVMHEHEHALQQRLAAHEPASEPQHVAAIDSGYVASDTIAPMA